MAAVAVAQGWQQWRRQQQPSLPLLRATARCPSSSSSCGARLFIRTHPLVLLMTDIGQHQRLCLVLSHPPFLTQLLTMKTIMTMLLLVTLELLLEVLLLVLLPSTSTHRQLQQQ